MKKKSLNIGFKKFYFLLIIENFEIKENIIEKNYNRKQLIDLSSMMKMNFSNLILSENQRENIIDFVVNLCNMDFKAECDEDVDWNRWMRKIGRIDRFVLFYLLIKHFFLNKIKF